MRRLATYRLFICLLLFLLVAVTLCGQTGAAAPTLTTPVTSNLGAGQVTVNSGEDITMNKAVTFTLKGGYDCDFANNISGGKTDIHSLTITGGTVIIENIEITALQ